MISQPLHVLLPKQGYGRGGLGDNPTIQYLQMKGTCNPMVASPRLSSLHKTRVKVNK